MSVINFRKLLESLKVTDLTEGKMNQLSLEIEQWVSDAYERYGHQVGGRDRALLAYRKAFPGFENKFIKKWNDAEMGERSADYLMNSVDEAEELDELDKKKLFNNYTLSLSREEVGIIRKAAMSGRFKPNIVKMEDDGDRQNITFRTGKPRELVKALEIFVDFGNTTAAEVLGIDMFEEEELEEAGYSNARPGENYDNTDQEMAMEYAKDEGMNWLRKKEGEMYLMSWVEAENADEKDGALEDLISSLQHVMVMGAYNTMNIDIEISTIEAEKFLGKWMQANGMTQITQESLENIYEADENIDEGVDRERVEAEGKKAASKGYDRRAPINYGQFSHVEKAWLRGFDSYKEVDEGSRQASFRDAGRGSQAGLTKISGNRIMVQGYNAAERGLRRKSPYKNERGKASWLKGYDQFKGDKVDSEIDAGELYDDDKSLNSGAWNKAEDPKYTKYDPPQTGNKNVSARKGFVGG